MLLLLLIIIIIVVVIVVIVVVIVVIAVVVVVENLGEPRVNELFLVFLVCHALLMLVLHINDWCLITKQQ